MIEIEFAELKNTYKILWLRYVYGVDLSQHCMKSLMGHNDSRVRGYMKTISHLQITEEAPYYYLCGVEQTFDWNKNLHLAFSYSFGSVINIDNEFIKCRIINARRQEISNKYINWRLPESRDRYYNTCRNWWFANMIVHNPNIRQAPRQLRMFKPWQM